MFEDDAYVRFFEAMAPEEDEIQREMTSLAAKEGFPIIGRTAGGVLHQLALATGAERIFEFGSGFGYSAYWFARALSGDGEIVLTEEDPAELEDAKAFLDRGGFGDIARFEAGNALETIDRYDGPFEVVLIDLAKEQYVAAFERVRDKVPPGGVIVADNALTAGSMDTDGIMQAVTTGSGHETLDEMAAGIVAYHEAVRADEAFATGVVPVGSGLNVAVKRHGESA